MITEGLLNIFFGIAGGFFELLPDITWTVDTSAWQYLRDFLDMIGYLLPMKTIGFVCGTILTLTFVRIVISFIRTVQ